MKLSIVRLFTLFLITSSLVSCGWTEKNVERSDEFEDRLSTLLDTDQDGLSDITEEGLGTDPNNPDTDGDGLSDGIEANSTRSNPLSRDTDGGGLSDGIEYSYGQSLLDSSDDNRDTDLGGVPDWIELGQGTDPLNPDDDIDNLVDSDDDGLSDALEIRVGLDPNKPDTDEDGLSDSTELLSGDSSPFLADTDGGGINDADELAAGTDPQNSYDDRNPIEVKINNAPASITNETNADFVFEISSNEDVESVMCAHNLDDKKHYEPCSSGIVFSIENLLPGTHRFTIKVLSKNNVLSTVHYQWTINEKPEKNCESADVKTKMISVSFGDQTKSCEYSKNGNLGRKNVFIQAMHEESKNLEIPTGAEICDLDLNLNQSFWFDDHFVLSWNSTVLATNTDFVMTQSTTLPTFDFDSIKGMKWSTQKPYCLGQSVGTECNVPKHDKRQNFMIDLSEAAKGQLMQAIQKAPQQGIELSILGDNDSSDCKHSGLSMDVEVKYLEAE